MGGRRDSQVEDEANYFAMCLLMPEHLVLREFKKMQPIDITDGDAIKRLAKIFDVTIDMMAIRLIQLAKTKKI